MLLQVLLVLLLLQELESMARDNSGRFIHAAFLSAYAAPSTAGAAAAVAAAAGARVHGA
jgi:hypothetical protein